MLTIELVNVGYALIGFASLDLNIDESSGVRPSARKSQYGIYANVAFQVYLLKDHVVLVEERLGFV
jgi:hypothetical protein